MSDLSIRQCNWEDIGDNPRYEHLASQYGTESANPEMPPMNVDYQLYLMYQTAGLTQWFGAYDGDELIGFIDVMISRHAHYSASIATIESFFVDKERRNTGAGLRLLKVAKQYAKNMDCVAIFLSAPTGSVLDDVMLRKGWTNSDQIFVKRLT